jgi:NADPH:quinone reductase
MSSPVMNAIGIHAFGGPEVLQLVQRPRPTPGLGEVLIRVSASGVNRPDVLQRKGQYAAPPGVSDIPGLEVAGRIVDGDPQAMAAAGLSSGDRVCALVAGGGYAEFCVAPVVQCLPVPKGWSDVDAASLPETAFTVWSNVFDRGMLASGETLLVHGGSSGIGVMAIQMAKAMGATVVVTAGSDDKCQACLDLGADHVINHRTQIFEDEVLKITDGRGVDVVLDMVAGAYIARGLSCLAQDGRLVVIAVQGGVSASFDAGVLMRKRLTITGSTLRARPVVFKAAIAQSLRDRVWPLMVRGAIKPVVHTVFEAHQARAAHALMESGRHIGKLVLAWQTGSAP